MLCAGGVDLRTLVWTPCGPKSAPPARLSAWRIGPSVSQSIQEMSPLTSEFTLIRRRTRDAEYCGISDTDLGKAVSERPRNDMLRHRASLAAVVADRRRGRLHPPAADKRNTHPTCARV